MQLQQFANLNTAIPLSALTSDPELVREIQGQLLIAGLLDPPIDGKFGPVSYWALREFCAAKDLKFSSQLTQEIASALLDAKSQTWPLNPGTNLAGKIVAALQRRGYWIARHPKCYNIVYVEGLNADGTLNNNIPNKFNDLRLLIQITGTGVPKITKAWEATTEPGKFWTENPMTPKGAARISFGQYKSWVVGTHHAGKPAAHEALVQTEILTVYRDLNKDFRRDGDTKYTGLFGINQHWGYDMPTDNLRKSSAGCLVGRTKAGHREFMSMLKSDPRYAANNAYRFMTAIVPAAAIDEMAFDPTQPH